MKKVEVEKFIKAIKKPNKLIKGCKKFHNMEPRDIAYVFARKIIAEKPDDIDYILASTKIILLTWNAVGFLRLNRKVKKKLETHIQKAYLNCKNEIRTLKNKKLHTLDLKHNKIVKKIKKVFLAFSSKSSIKKTGASKILHIINPDIFMIWDSSVRQAYHKFHREKEHNIDDCYIEFLVQTKEIISEILSQQKEKVLWENHLSFLDKNFVKKFSVNETILKMLDECNYVRFTLEKKF